MGSDSRPQGDRVAEGKSEASKASPSHASPKKTAGAFYNPGGNFTPMKNQVLGRATAAKRHHSGQTERQQGPGRRLGDGGVGQVGGTRNAE